MKLRLIAVVATLLFVTGAAHAQCGVSSVNYTTYATSSSDGTTFSATVTVSGTASMSNDNYLLCQEGTTHTPYAYNSLNGGGGWESGPSGCPSCYISETNFQQFSSSGLTDWTWQGEVDCSKAGFFYVSQLVDDDHEDAITYSQNSWVSCGTDSSGHVDCYELNELCTLASSPPDFRFEIVDTANGLTQPQLQNWYFNAKTDCLRPKGSPKGTSWSCFPTTQVSPRSKAEGDAGPYKCTNKDLGTTGSYPTPSK